MEERHRDLLCANSFEITSDLRFRDIRGYLLDKGVLSEDNLNEIESKKSREDQAKALLDILPTRGPHAFSVFSDALKLHYSHLARLLNDESPQEPFKGGETPEPRIFIIHAGEDKEHFVRPLVSALKDRGLEEDDIFFDEISIKPGEHIRERIMSTLSSDALQLAVIVVSTSLLNKNYWPKLELEKCLNKKCLFPIWLDENEDNFKAFSELVGNYSPTLKQMSARRVQRTSVENELANIATEVVQQLSALEKSQPSAMQMLLYAAPTSARSADSVSSDEETSSKDDGTSTSSDDEQLIEEILKERKRKTDLEMLGKWGEIQLKLIKEASGLLSKEKVEQQTEEMFAQLRQKFDILMVKVGCAIVHIVPNNVTDLDRFWADYKSGKLSEELSHRLITDEMRALVGQDLVVQVIMLEEQYWRWRQYLSKDFNLLERFKMAESKLLHRLSEDFLECKICLQPYRRPKVLSCLHSFCQRCLEEFLKKQKVKTELNCPTCRTRTLLSRGGVAKLKDNFFVESLRDTVDVHKKLTNEGERLVCGSCEAKSGAESFCTECGDFLCDECVAIHRRIKVSKDHQIIGIEQLKSAESNTIKIKPRPLPPCKVHSQETLKLFCVDCSEAICQLCTVLSHKDHKYEYFADTAVKVKGEIGALLAKAEKKVGDLKNAGQQAHAQKTKLDKNVTETVEKIKRKAEQTRRELVALVNQQEAELLDRVNTVSHTRSKEFSTAIEEIETATVALESAAEFGRNVVEHGSEFEIMAVSGEVNGRLKKLLAAEIVGITEELPAKAYIAFEEDKTSDMAKPRLGDVKTNEDSGLRTARLTTLGTTGRLGPTSLGTHYRGQDHERLVQLKDGIQYFTVPDSGQYRIEAAGSAAGWGQYDPKSARGRGAVVRGTFQLKKGEVLKILVGQEGLENKSASGVGGGGGTFVTKRDNTPLIVAGGAGGGNCMIKRNPNSDGTTAAAGQSSSGPGDNFTGGSDGKGATHGDNDHVGGGGGGLLTDGASGKVNFGGTDGNFGGEGGKAFVNGSVGGRGVYHNAEGGFGGGGGSLGRGGGGGGGGGYSGGGRGDNYNGACGGGGGSYNSGSDTSGEGGANDGPGYVILTRTV